MGHLHSDSVAPCRFIEEAQAFASIRFFDEGSAVSLNVLDNEARARIAPRAALVIHHLQPRAPECEAINFPFCKPVNKLPTLKFSMSISITPPLKKPNVSIRNARRRSFLIESL